MNGSRARRAIVARALALLVFINGMCCSIGHGQMLQHMLAPPAKPMMMVGHSMSMPTGVGEQHSASMGALHSLFSDCFFAGSVPLGLLLFSLLAWLIAARPARPLPPAFLLARPPRGWLTALNPQAP